jgi:hypothetical protein
MKHTKPLLAAGLLLALVPIALLRNVWGDVRSVIPYAGKDAAQSAPFDPAQSTALFVGISKFHEDHTLADVRYAVDDAVDLAYAFTLGCGFPLVRPARVVLAITGQPRKEESKLRLQELLRAGATLANADQADVRKLLRGQAGLAGANGLFIVSFATHGFSRDGEHYLLSASSTFDDAGTTLSAASIFDDAGSSAARSLIFVDACRERVHDDSRAVGPEPKSAAPLVSAMRKIAGQVVFYAAPAGGYAFDDEKRRNGVFTAAVIEALSCGTATKRDILTVEKLSVYVEKSVLAWVRKHRDRSARKATQLNTEGSTRSMPVAVCGTPPPPPAPALSRVAFDGDVLTAYGDPGKSLWQQRVVGRIRTVRVGELFRKRRRQVVVVSDDERGDSLISAFEQNGTLLFAYHYPGRVDDLTIAQRTSHYDPKIIVTATSAQFAPALHVAGPVVTVFILDPKRTAETGRPLWHGAILPAPQTIAHLRITDYDGDHQQDIALSTSTGSILHLEFDGTVITTEPGRRGTAHFTWIGTQPQLPLLDARGTNIRKR